jgi:hypothetical protein
MTDTRKKWLLTGIKRTRRHEIRLLADTADEAIALAKSSYRFSSITDCVEDPPKRLPGGGFSLGWAAHNDPIYENAGWNFLIGKNLNPHLR